MSGRRRMRGGRDDDRMSGPGRLVVCPTPIGNLEDVTLRVLSALREADVVACDAMEAIGRALGVGLASIVNMLNPEVIVIGGGVIAAGEMLLEPARREMRERALLPARDAVRIVAAEFGDQAGMIGAALMAREAIAGGAA